MAVLTSTLIFSFVCACSASHAIHVKTADLGADVVLDCTDSSSNINLVVWSRPDLETEEFVFFFSKRRGPVKSYQLRSYHDRVSLQDPQMTEGNIAVVLTNVTISDIGTYECKTMERKSGRRKRAAEPELQSRNKIKLTVGKTESGGHIGLPVAVGVVVVAAVSVVVWKRSTKKKAEEAAADGADEKINLSDP
ncbi:uncharacterized protein V6R79_026331 [Siganus canaliculatus]